MAYKEQFRHLLEVTQDYNELYKYECLQNYRAHWDLSELDLHRMYDLSYSSSISGRLWGGSTNSAKEYMLRFIEMDKEFVRSMFRDLFDEKKNIGLRINRFKFHCDELLRQLNLKDHKHQGHYHDDGAVLLYLAFEYPDLYCLHAYGPFSIMMNRMDTRDVPEDFEIERYLKLCKALYTILKKDEDLLAAHQKQLEPIAYKSHPGQLLIHDFLMMCSLAPTLPS